MRGPQRLLTDDELTYLDVSKQPKFSTLSFTKADANDSAIMPEDEFSDGNSMGDSLRALVAPHIESFDCYFGENGRLVNQHIILLCFRYNVLDASFGGNSASRSP
jgi:hypothetical protein